MVKVYVAADTGPSGFGVASRGLVRHLLEEEEFDVTLRTHFWGWNPRGIVFDEDNQFPDTRFKEYLRRNGLVNDDYMVETAEEAQRRETDFTTNLGTNTTVDPEKCMVRQFEGKEDVWIAIGGAGFAEHAPQDEDIHTVLSTDFNLDVVPHDWEYYLEQVDEVWVPSEWVKSAIERRLGDSRPDIVERTRALPYGVPTNYEPTAYDCEACPEQHRAFRQRGPENESCLKDGKFNFLVISRFYHIKGLYRTVRAFVQEFDGHEDVRLFLKTTSNQQFDFNPMQSVQSVVEEVGKPEPPEIGMKVAPFDTQHLYDLMGQCDAFLQASRAECFGIAQFQAAYCRTPVVATNWAAQAELIPDDQDGFFLLDDYTVERPRPDSRAFMFAGSDSYPPDSHWASPDVDALGRQMREIYELEEEELERQGEAARQYVSETFDWSDRIKPRLERIREAGR